MSQSKLAIIKSQWTLKQAMKDKLIYGAIILK